MQLQPAYCRNPSGTNIAHPALVSPRDPIRQANNRPGTDTPILSHCTTSDQSVTESLCSRTILNETGLGTSVPNPNVHSPSASAAHTAPGITGIILDEAEA
jgi:hypothetical protein